MIEYIKFIEKNCKKMGLFFVLSCFVLLFSQKVVGMEVFDYESQVASPIKKLEKVETDEQNKNNIITHLVDNDLIKLVAKKNVQKKYIKDVTGALRSVLEGNDSEQLKKFAIESLVGKGLIEFVQTDEHVKEGTYIKSVIGTLSRILKGKEENENVKQVAIEALVREELIDLVKGHEKTVVEAYIKGVISSLRSVLEGNDSEQLEKLAIESLVGKGLIEFVQTDRHVKEGTYIKGVIDTLSKVLKEKKKNENVK
jgi:hypothetical protein